MEDGFDIIQYRVKRLCNKPESNTDLLHLIWTSRLQLWTCRKLGQTCPWTREKNPYFHMPASENTMAKGVYTTVCYSFDC